MMNNFPGSRTKIRWRGGMLVAWFADATPPVLWRWMANDISAGFGLKKEDGRIELVKHEAATGSTVIAAFPNEARAQAGLAYLSDALMEFRAAAAPDYAPRRSLAGLVWKWASSILLSLLLIFFAYTAARVLTFLGDPIGAVMKTTNGAAMTAPSPAPAQATARPQQPQSDSPLPFPFTAMTRPTAPPASSAGQGKPVDADTLFH